MRKTLFTICFAVFWGAIAFQGAFAQQRISGETAAVAPRAADTGGTSPAAHAERHRFKVGEKLVYSVKITSATLGLDNGSVARLTTEVVGKGQYHGREGYHLVVKAQTVGLIKALFDLDDRFTTYLDAATRLPYRTEREIKESGRVESGATTFDQAKRQALIDDARTVELKGESHDLAGMLWAVRNLDLTGDRMWRISGLDDRSGKPFTVEVERLQAATQTVAGKSLEAFELAVRPLDKEGRPSDDLKLRIWITNDAQRYPALITGARAGTQLRAELTRTPEE